MVDIAPFSGLLFNQDKTGSITEVVAPPYDVIRPHQQEELYEKNPYNVVRLILGKQYPDDNENNNRYTRSAKDFQEWVKEGILTQDKQPCFYVYSQDYSVDGQPISRVGFFARVKLEDFSEGNICPHEFTLAKAKKDRTHLLEACRANFSPIFGLFSDPQEEIDKKLEKIKEQTPLGVIADGQITHRLWRLDDKEIIDSLTASFRNKKIFIADGHHRYETALAYSKRSESKGTDSKHVMIFLTNMESQSLSIFPIHRLIRCPSPFNREDFLTKIGKYFDVKSLPGQTPAEEIKAILEKQGSGDNIVFIVYMKDGGHYLLQLKDTQTVVPHLGPDDPENLQILDVVQLHALVIKSILGVDTKDPGNQQYVSYNVNIDEAKEKVNAGEYDLAFFMNPTLIKHVRDLAEKGIRLPQKATYFYPKLLSGLVINKFES